MTDMIEKMARAVRRQQFERTRRLSAFDENYEPNENELADALAALEALREPTMAMKNVGLDTAEGIRGVYAYKAMIDKALEGK
jgi:hypothetical protein